MIKIASLSAVYLEYTHPWNTIMDLVHTIGPRTTKYLALSMSTPIGWSVPIHAFY